MQASSPGISLLEEADSRCFPNPELDFARFLDLSSRSLGVLEGGDPRSAGRRLPLKAPQDRALSITEVTDRFSGKTEQATPRL